MNSTAKISALLVSAGLGLSLTACTAPGGTTTSTTTTPATVVVAAPASPTTTSTTTKTEQPTMTPLQPTSEGPQVIRVEPGAERTLTRADAFAAANWGEGSYQAVGQAQASQALAAEPGCYNSPTLEFRFAQNQGTLKFTVAQAMTSQSSAETQEWALLVDGRQAQTKSIAFKDSAELSTPLSGVAVVQLKVKQTAPCHDRSIGLVTSAVITG